MASQITYVGAGNEKAIELINSHFARSFSIGTDWNKLRVAIRYTLTKSPNLTLTGTPRWFVGLSHGTSSVFGDSYVSHSVGMVSTSANWGFQIDSQPYYYSMGFTGCVKSGSVLQVGTNTVDSAAQSVLSSVIESSGSVQSLLFVDMDKNFTSNSISCSIFYRTTNVQSTTYTREQFYFYAEQTVPSLTNYMYTGYLGLGSAFRINESLYGTLDSICVSWDRTVPRINILDLAIYKLS